MAAEWERRKAPTNRIRLTGRLVRPTHCPLWPDTRFPRLPQRELRQEAASGRFPGPGKGFLRRADGESAPRGHGGVANRYADGCVKTAVASGHRPVPQGASWRHVWSSTGHTGHGTKGFAGG